jgi:hypothetical protein
MQQDHDVVRQQSRLDAPRLVATAEEDRLNI